MKKYRKTALVQAFQYLGNDNELWDMASVPVAPQRYKDGSFYIQTVEGDMRCRVGDYIVRGIKGEYYPVAKNIFEESYEEVQ